MKKTTLEDMQREYAEKQKKEREGLQNIYDGGSYHTKMAIDRDRNPSMFQQNNKDIQDGIAEARSLQKQYLNPTHPDHEKARALFQSHGFNYQVVRKDIIDRKIAATGSKRFEAKNSSYEQNLIDAAHRSSGNSEDHAFFAAVQNAVKQKWHDQGYSNFSDAGIFDTVRSKYNLSNSDHYRAKVQAVWNSNFGPEKMSRDLDMLDR